jgi:hypothetical protein
MCECACATVFERFTLADHFFSFGEDESDKLHHQVT